MRDFPSCGKKLLFYSSNLKAAGSKAGTSYASLFLAPCNALSSRKSSENVEVLQQVVKQTLKSGSKEKQCVKAYLFQIKKTQQLSQIKLWLQIKLHLVLLSYK